MLCSLYPDSETPLKPGAPGAAKAQPSPYPICEHIKVSGQRCGSPALRGQEYCYYHNAVRQRVPENNFVIRLWDPRTGRAQGEKKYEMPYLEDSESIQIAFSQLTYLISQEEIQMERAWLMLSALHGAAHNLRVMEWAAARRDRAAARKNRSRGKPATPPATEPSA